MALSRRTLLQAAPLALLNAAPAKRKNWCWIPTNLRRTDDEWKFRFELMRESGVSAILPEIYNGRVAHYASTRLPVENDWLGRLLKLAKPAGLEVHAWMWSMPCMLDDILKKHPDWYNVNALGESAATKPAYVPYYKFLDPGHPEVREWVKGTVTELASIPELDGVHLDYIRHPDAILPKNLWKKYNIVQDKVYPPYDYGYTEYERAQFKKKHGADPMDLKDPALHKKWLEFRWEMVTGLVNDYLVPAARAKKKRITAAVFPGPSLARINVMQDWGRWKLDAFLPMLYHTFYNEGPEWVGTMTREGISESRKPLYSGLFIGQLSVDEFKDTVKAAVQAGASGVALFSDGGMSAAKWAALRQL
jgi:uncharacterized lipoprotein YddW (UPF0748 family)